MKPKVLFLDLDLTLLRSDGSLSDYTVEVLKKCQAKGVMIAFCTSRGSTTLEKYAVKVQPEIIIANAGACIYYKDKLIHSEAFTIEETHSLLDATYEALGPDAEITVDTVDDFYWNRMHDKATQYMPESKYHTMKDFPEPIMKFCVATTDKEAVDKITSVTYNCEAMIFSDIPWYRFSPKSAKKENGISFLSKYLNIPIEQMAAFGDDYSDIGMLKLCGRGIAMANAIEPVKQIADEITESCDEDGVALWIERNILK